MIKTTKKACLTFLKRAAVLFSAVISITLGIVLLHSLFSVSKYLHIYVVKDFFPILKGERFPYLNKIL